MLILERPVIKSHRTVRPRWRWLLLTAAVFVLLYLGSYAVFYRRGVIEAERWNWDYFVYVPMDDVIAAKKLSRQHELLALGYAPLNDLHRQWFGGRCACRCIHFTLSKSFATRNSERRMVVRGVACGATADDRPRLGKLIAGKCFIVVPTENLDP